MFARPTTPLLLSLLASVCAISACTVGPDYAGAPQVAPDAAHASNFVRTPAAGMVSTRAPSQWWLSLNDPQLNALIDAALAHNPDVHAAQARLREARAQLQHQKANGMPNASFDAAALRMREPNLSSLSSLRRLNRFAASTTPRTPANP